MTIQLPGETSERMSRWNDGRLTFVLALGSGLLLWLAFPPVGWWPLAWGAPVFWLLLIRMDRLPGRRPYLTIGVAGFLHWLLMMQGIRLAHPALYLGWLALSAYLTVYTLLFLGLSRVAVHQFHCPVVVAAPVVWTGLELVRGHALTGFSMALLGHTQFAWTSLLQIADTFGAYGVTFVVMWVAACVARVVPLGLLPGGEAKRRWTFRPLLPLAVVLGGTLLYGGYRLREVPPAESTERPLRVALIQGSFDTIFEYNPERDADAFLRYCELSERAIDAHADLDLIVWPESAFTGNVGEVLIEGEPVPPPEMPMESDEYRRRLREWSEAFRRKTREVAQGLNRLRPKSPDADSRGLAFVVGTDSQHFGAGRPRRYNSALFIDPDGTVVGRYYKMHLVAFGEYIPFADTFPWLYRVTPMTQGIDTGAEPQVFEAGGLRLAPSVCFESTVPHLIRRQLAELESRGQTADALINVTNDGWFWGSSILDYHLACGVFRAIETRLPLLVAANTGLSAHIDCSGRVVSQGPRRDEAVLFAEVRPGLRSSPYRVIGDAPWWLCVVLCGLLAIAGVARRRRGSKQAESLE